MKKIIKHGLFDDPIHTKVCPSCKCVFEYDDDDTSWEFNDIKCDSRSEQIRCPQCGHWLQHKE